MARICSRCGGTGTLPEDRSIRRGIGSSTAEWYMNIHDLCSCSAGKREKVRRENYGLSKGWPYDPKKVSGTIPIKPTYVPPMPLKRESSIARELETLAELHKRGLLTDHEFHLAKKRLLEG